MLELLGTGYPRTGTQSLCEALTILGIRADRDAISRLQVDQISGVESFRLFDDVEAIIECTFWREIHALYRPKIVLTVGAETDWWQSMRRHAYNVLRPRSRSSKRSARALHALQLGTYSPNEFVWRKRYREHNASVRATCAAEGIPLLVLDVTHGDPWPPLCEFLSRPLPTDPFPWIGRGQASRGR